MRVLIAVLMLAAGQAVALQDFSTPEGCRERLLFALRATHGAPPTFERETAYAAQVPDAVRAEAQRYVELTKQIDALERERTAVLMQVCAAYPS